MRKKVRDKMLADYKAIGHCEKGTCVKYRYEYNKTNVNIYFDAYDKNSYSLSIILNAEKKFYFTTLNIMNTSIRKEYLPELPSVLLNNIVINGTLDDFYNYMEDKIIQITPLRLSYQQDKIFTNTVSFNKGEIDLPFWWHIRKSKMTDKTLEELSERADISRDLLIKIQKKGLTLVRTADSNKRCDLKFILGKENIELS